MLPTETISNPKTIPSFDVVDGNASVVLDARFGFGGDGGDGGDGNDGGDGVDGGDKGDGKAGTPLFSPPFFMTTLLFCSSLRCR